MGLDRDWFLPDPPRALVTIVDPDQAQGGGQRLRALYGLTASEAAVAVGVASGRDIKSVAADLRLTVDTARQYLKRVFAKTQTGRQHELARLVTLIDMAP